MTDEHIGKILDIYVKRENIDEFAHVANFEEIKKMILISIFHGMWMLLKRKRLCRYLKLWQILE